MITEYKGPSNSCELFKHLIGETVIGVVEEGNHFILALSSGDGLVLTSFGGQHGPCYWRMHNEELRGIIERREETLRANIAAIESTRSLSETLKKASNDNHS